MTNGGMDLLRDEIDRLRAKVERLTKERDEAQAFREAAEQDAVRAAGKYEALKRLREAPTPKPRPDREAIGRAAYEAHGTKGLHPWEKLNESAREDYRELGCAVAAALQPPAPPDIEAAARRIVLAIEASVGLGRDDTDDARAISARYHELAEQVEENGWSAARHQARVEFVARVLAEMGSPKAPAAIVLLEHDEPGACTADAHAFESADDPASVRLEDEARAADRMSQLAFVRHWTWHPASTRPADGGTP